MASFNTVLGFSVVCLLLNFAIGSPDDSSHGSRGLLPKPTSCNYATEPGLSCVSCKEILFCNRNNEGFITSCGFLSCNKGLCSLFPEPNCDEKTSSTSTTTTTTEKTNDKTTLAD